MILVLFSILTSCSEGGISQPSPLDMITVDVPSGGGDGITFPTGLDDSGTATLTSSFRMRETEVTNKLVAEIFQWALEQGYLIETADAHNEVNEITVKYGEQELYDMNGSYCRIQYSSGFFSLDEGYEKNPIVNISWYGAVMICNWLTEMKDGDTNNVVYYTIDETWTHTETSTYSTRTGYRFPQKTNGNMLDGGTVLRQKDTLIWFHKTQMVAMPLWMQGITGLPEIISADQQHIITIFLIRIVVVWKTGKKPMTGWLFTATISMVHPAAGFQQG